MCKRLLTSEYEKPQFRSIFVNCSQGVSQAAHEFMQIMSQPCEAC